MTDVAFEMSIAQRQALGVAENAVRVVTATRPWHRDGDVAQPDQQPDLAELTTRLRDLAERYDILRTTFTTPVGMTRHMQSIQAVPTVEVRRVTDTDLARVIAEDRSRPFDLGGGASIRLTLTGSHLVLTAPAAIADERSLTLLLDELRYARADSDPLQFVDYASWEAEQQDDDGADARIARVYWANVVGVDLMDQEALGERDAHELPVLDVAPLHVPSRAATEEEWLAAWGCVLQRHAGPGRDRAVVAVAVSGRVDAELDTAIGPYERYVPVVIDVDEEATLESLTSRVGTETAAAARFAVFAPPPRTEAGFAARNDTGSAGRGAFPLELVVSGGTATLWYARASVPSRRAEFLVAELSTLLDAVAADPAAALATVDVRGPAEQALVADALHQDSAAELPAAATSIPAMVNAVVARRPDARAVVCGDEALTYAELAGRASSIATAVGDGAAPVAVLLDRSTDSVAAALGVLLTGAAYVPLDPSHPPAYWSEQMEAVGAKVVVSTHRYAADLPGSVRVVAVETLDDQHARTNGAGPAVADSIAYLIFTSGSTGRPKPVAVTHGNVLAYTHGLTTRLGLDESVRFAAVTGMSTDLGNTAVFGALLNGGTLDVVLPDDAADASTLAALIDEHGITALKTTPSHLRALLAEGTARLPLELLVVGGEALGADVVEQARRAGARRIVNHYGPTETTVGAFTYEVPDEVSAPVPIGQPLPHVRALVLDHRGVPAPFGATGELVIAGSGVSAGYLGRPEDSERSFPPEPGRPGRRMYRTGDHVRLRNDGLAVFEGRGDGQIKVRGYRVEIGEIEDRLRADPSVAEAAVTADGDELVAYLVAAGGGIDVDMVRGRLAARAPQQLVPTRLVVLDRLPLTPSGKLDRRRLRDQERPAPAVAVREPRTETEAELVSIWKQVLSLPAVGIDDDFFRIGGHSLVATKAVARCRASFGVDLPLHIIFAHPTIEAIAAEIDERRNRSADDLADLLDQLDALTDEEAAGLLDSEPSRHGDDL